MKSNIHRPRNAAGLFLRASTTALAASVAAPSALWAQSAEEADDVVIVTGSRLNQANLTSASPVFTVNAGEVDTRGAARIEDLLNVLPQTLPAQGSALANGATGTSTVDLRGLGANRTLVLMDGKRLPYGLGNGLGVGANLDLVPTQLVERVDIVTGGASAVYGSDAVAGVVNFIMKRDFEGFEVDGQVGFFQDGNNGDFANEILNAFNQPAPGGQLDGRGVNISALFGANTADGRGNVTAFLQYQDQNEIRQSARDYSACAYDNSSAPNAVGGVGCVGSSTFRSIGPFQDFGTDLNGDGQIVAADGEVFDNGLFVNPDGTLVPYTGAANQTFNFAPDNFIQRNNERFNFAASAFYEVTPGIEAFLDLGYTENTTDSQIAFSGTFFRNFEINCDNPTLVGATNPNPGPLFGQSIAESFLGCTPAQIAGAADDVDVGFGGSGGLGIGSGTGPGYRNVSGTPRSQNININTFRAVGGLRGEIDDRWNWEVFGQFARTRLRQINTGDMSFDRLQDSFFAVTDPGTGETVCRDGAFAGCQPINFFTNPTGDIISAEYSQQIQGTAIITGVTNQIVLGGTFGGDAGFGTPWADTNIQALVGVEYRRDDLDRTPDELARIPGGFGLTGVGGGTLPVQGEVEVAELFFETQIPIVEGRPFFEELSISGAFRFSDYTTEGQVGSDVVDNSFNTETFAAGAAWAPVPDARFRFQFQRAIRAPNVFDLFTGQNTGLFNGTEPCGPGTAFTPAQCANTGLPPSLYNLVADNPAGQLNQVTGGNPFLGPESADTYTAGVILQPRFIDGLTVSADYYDISIDDAIGTIPSNTSLSQCLTTGAAQFCNNVVRDQDGSLWSSPIPPAGSPFQFAGVQATNVNVANISTRGIDVNAAYSMDLEQIGVNGAGSLAFNYASTFLLERSFIPVPGVTDDIECKGLYRGNCGATIGAVNPEYVHRFLTTWKSPYNLDLTLTWRHVGGTTFDEASTGGNLSEGGTFTPTGNVLDDFLDAANYVDLAAQWYVKENLTMRAGVNNLLGRDPELSTEAGTAPGNGDTFPQFYDPAGRFIFVGVNVAF